MSWHIDGMDAGSIAVDVITAADAVEEYGAEDPNGSAVLALEISGNQHVVLIEGTPEEWKALAERILERLKFLCAWCDRSNMDTEASFNGKDICIRCAGEED